jgi:hypothetical protein
MQQAEKAIVERPERRAVDMRGFALGPNRDSNVCVSDLSYSGCQLQSEDAFKVGEVVELRVIKRGAIKAEIRWSADGCAGALFLN